MLRYRMSAITTSSGADCSQACSTSRLVLKFSAEQTDRRADRQAGGRVYSGHAGTRAGGQAGRQAGAMWEMSLAGKHWLGLSF